MFNVPKGLRKILDRDLVAAGIARMVTDEKTGKQRIDKRDDRGRTIDVHALLHTFGTWLSKGGVPLRTAQAAMRHSTPTLTANVYTDPRLLDVHGALDALPSLPLNSSSESNKLSATGTAGDRQLVPTLVHDRESESHPVTGRSSRVVSEKPSAVAASACYGTKKDSLSLSDNESFKIGMTRFERATSCSQSRRSSQAELHPVCAAEFRGEVQERQFGRGTPTVGYLLWPSAVVCKPVFWRFSGGARLWRKRRGLGSADVRRWRGFRSVAAEYIAVRFVLRDYVRPRRRESPDAV